MGGCSAVGCKSKGANGVMQKCFPKDPALRAVWEVKVRRPGWKPAKSSRLCEKHFDEYQWETPRQDGKRKLKWNAIPTIFAHTKPVKPRKPPTIRKPLEKPMRKRRKAAAHKEISQVEAAVSATKVNETSKNVTQVNVIPVNMTPVNVAKDSSASTSKAKDDEVDKDKLIDFLKSTIERHRKDIFVKERQLMSLRRLLADHRQQKHRDKERNNRLEAKLKQVFNDDQLKAIGRSSVRFMKWSNETINTALELKLACGWKGYKHLLKLRLPFPSLRTLQRAQAEEIEPQVLRDMLEEPSVDSQ